MKKLILFFALIPFMGIFKSQSLPKSPSIDKPNQQFILNKYEFTDYIVIDVKNKSKQYLYKLTKDWISDTYRSPKDVIKNDVENEKIRIEGIAKDLICPYHCNDVNYQIEISFKDGKYKFDVIDVRTFYNKDWFVTGFGSGKLTNEYEHFNNLDNVPKYFNELNEKLLQYISADKKDNW